MKSCQASTIGLTIYLLIGSAIAAPRTSLTLVKEVAGGEATATNWILTADGADANDLSGPGQVSGDVLPDTFHLSESAGPSDYTAGDWHCTEGGVLDGQSLTLPVGEDVTCTIINTYTPPVVVFDLDLALPSMPAGDGSGTPVCVDDSSGLLVAGCDLAIGPAGPEGPQGLQGEPGPQGLQGEKGDPGPTVITLDDISSLGTKLNINNDLLSNLDTELSLIKAKLSGIEDSLEADLASLTDALADPAKMDFKAVKDISEKNIVVTTELEELYAMIHKAGGFALGLTALSNNLDGAQHILLDSVNTAAADNTNLIVVNAIAVANQSAQLARMNTEFTLITHGVAVAAQRVSGNIVMLAAVNSALDLLIVDRTFTAVGTSDDDYGFYVLRELIMKLDIAEGEYIYINVYKPGVDEGAKLCSNDARLRSALGEFAFIGREIDYRYRGFNEAQTPTTTWVKGTGGSWSPASSLSIINQHAGNFGNEITITATGENGWGFAGGLLDDHSGGDYPNPVDVTGYYTNDVAQPLNFTIKVGPSQLAVCLFNP